MSTEATVEGTFVPAEKVESQQTTLKGAYDQVPPKTEPDPVSGDDFKKLIPEPYRAKPYLSEVDNMEKLLKKLEGAQSLAGKKKEELIPGDKATKEEREAFHKLLGKPEKAEDYAFEHPKDLGYDEAFSKQLKQAYHEAGLSKSQAEAVQKQVDALYLDQYKEVINAEASMEKEFTEATKAVFGESKEKALAVAKKLIEENVPDGFESKIVGLSNDQLIVLAGVVYNMAKKYVGEDKMPDGGSGGSTGVTPDSIAKELQTLVGSDAYRNEFNPGNTEAKKRARELSQQLASAGAS